LHHEIIPADIGWRIAFTGPPLSPQPAPQHHEIHNFVLPGAYRDCHAPPGGA
jgi:hypothetical protein